LCLPKLWYHQQIGDEKYKREILHQHVTRKSPEADLSTTFSPSAAIKNKKGDKIVVFVLSFHLDLKIKKLD